MSHLRQIALAIAVAAAAGACVREADRVVVVVRPTGDRTGGRTLSAALTLDGAPATEVQRFPGDRAELDLQLDGVVSGTVGITVSLLGCDGCVHARGAAEVRIAGNGRYDVDVPLAHGEPAGCIAGMLAHGRMAPFAALLDRGPHAGQVLVAGGVEEDRIELYDPTTDVATLTSHALQAARTLSGVTLRDGRVLLVGGFDGLAVRGEVDLYDPMTDTLRAAAPLNRIRTGHLTVALADGRALAIGGHVAPGPLLDAEIYDPALDRWTSAGTFKAPHTEGTAVLLRDGRVLVAGGANYPDPYVDLVEIFDPEAPASPWSVAGHMSQARWRLTSTLLDDGRVLLAGGETWSDIPSALVEIFDPAAPGAPLRTAGPLSQERPGAELLKRPGGGVLAVGGGRKVVSRAVDRWIPDGERFTAAAPLAIPRIGHALVPLPDGRVLALGGAGGPEVPIENAPLLLPVESLYLATCAPSQERE